MIPGHSIPRNIWKPGNRVPRNFFSIKVFFLNVGPPKKDIFSGHLLSPVFIQKRINNCVESRGPNWYFIFASWCNIMFIVSYCLIVKLLRYYHLKLKTVNLSIQSINLSTCFFKFRRSLLIALPGPLALRLLWLYPFVVSLFVKDPKSSTFIQVH